MGLASVTALVLGWWVQVPDFSAPVVAFFGLLPGNVCTWGNLAPRLVRVTAGAIVSIVVAGVLVQLPWLLLPTFFAGAVLIAYVNPITHGGLELLGIAYPFITAFYVGVFDPAGMPTAVGNISVGYAIGLATATVFSRLLSPDDPAATLADALASGFALARRRLEDVTARYADERFEAPLGEAPVSTQFARDMQLLARLRQDGRSRDDVPFFALAVVVVDRALTLIDTMDALGRRSVGRTYRRALVPQLTVLVGCVDAGLGAFEMAMRERGRSAATLTPRTDTPWADYRAAVEAAQAQQDALRRTGALASVDIAEEANTEAFVKALIDLADSLRASPEDLYERVTTDAGPAPVTLPRLDPHAARYALAVGLGTTLGYLAALVADRPELFNILFHPMFLAVSTYGATIRRAGTRLAGTLVGCVVAIGATIAVMPNIVELPALALLLLAVVVPSAYVVLGPPRFSYVGVQIVVAFVIVALTEQPLTDVHLALWRVYGTLLGTAALFLAFRAVGADYAGRQLVVRFAQVVREMLAALPGPDGVSSARTRAEAMRRRTATSLPDILSLANEARAEPLTGGVDTAAAITAAGRAVRIAYRLAAVRGGRAAHVVPELLQPMRTALADFIAAIRAWLDVALGMLEARETTARPGSRAHHEACAAAAVVAERPRPDLAAALGTLEHAIDEARSAEPAGWPPAERAALVADLEHLRRLVELLPSFDESLRRMILPEQKQQVRLVTSSCAG